MEKLLLRLRSKGFRKLALFLCIQALFFAPLLASSLEYNNAGLFEKVDLTSAYDQIRGTVKDVTGEPIPGATILIEGKGTGTATDIDGNFTIEANQGDVLVISFIGYQVKKVSIGTQTTINVVLDEDMSSLEEVIVVGYGTQEKRNITGAISSLDQRSIREIPVASAVEAMQGQVAGVDVVSSGGRPGQAPQILIRGRRSISASNDPLYVIDGIPQTSASSAIFDINPQDITSMEVLKDAAATAIYGSRGANGVVIITTQRGATTGVTTVSYDGYYGISNVSERPPPSIFCGRGSRSLQA